MPIVLDGTDSIGDLGDALNAKLNLAGGKILQIVRATDTTNRSTTSTTFVDVTGMSITITPQKSDSAVIVILSVGAQSSGATSSLFGRFRITDASNNPISGAERADFGTANLDVIGTGFIGHYLTLLAFATPATTSAVTFKAQFTSTIATATIEAQNSTTTGQMYAIEVSA